MAEFIARKAMLKDVPFLVETIIEAEKSGTDKLSYTTIFGLSLGKTRDYISQMLFEEVDGCELSISSFIVIESNGDVVAAAAAWIEGQEGVPSSVIKGNLLNYTLPKECIVRAMNTNKIISDLHIDNRNEAIQLGLVYVDTEFRGLNLVNILINEQVVRLLKVSPNTREINVQVFGNNIAAIKSYERANFKIVMERVSKSRAVLDYLPSNKKLLMRREL